ncbi:DUF937 domain-containing protein [Streptomyces sp. P9(2023)]|uniref:DUF937 domain-containing protein n=1 Tax=Streptomyces sp. P9(2023) TaxID=3064394 RepID=UPI0028F436CA|nr:DUF937 domain-containing protein [Streptomyces sp. P9(2023)]MDT9689137.1 DUF937 domain-containing protein [Streptomyces sp. P9(2023)]
MSDDSFEKDVLQELGDDRLQEVAALLGTDAAEAQQAVGSSASALSGELRQAASEPGSADEVRQAVEETTSDEPPLQGVASLGGLASGGLMAGVLAKLSRPAANAVAKKTGIPAATAQRTIEILIPVVLAVITKRAAGKKADAGAGAGAGTGTGTGAGGLGDILGGGQKK